jgi:hypothetical protein
MATMWYKNVNCNVVYVDPAATGTATGVTPNDAILDLPTPSAMSGGTVYLLRRGAVTPATYTLGKTTCAQDSVAIWGMPLSTDEQYAMVPVEAKTAWDADAATRPILQTLTQTTVYPQFTGFGASMHRVNLQFGFTAVHQNTVPALHFNGDAVSLTHVKSQLTGFDMDVVTTNTPVTTSKILSSIRFFGKHVVLADCEFQAPVSKDGDLGSYAQTFNTDAVCYRNRDGVIIINNCVFRGGRNSYGNNTGGLSCISVVARVCYLYNSTFDLCDYRSNNAVTQNVRSAFKIGAKLSRIFNNTITTRPFASQGSATPGINYVTDSDASASCVGTPVDPLAIICKTNMDTTNAPDDGTWASDTIVDGLTIDASGLRHAPSGLIVNSSSDAALYPGAYQIVIRNYSFTAPQAARLADTIVGLYVPAGGRVFVENAAVHYSNTMGFALACGSAANGTGFLSEYNNSKSTFRNCAASGRIRLDSVRYAEITSLTITGTDIAYPLECYGGVFYIGTMTIPSGWVATGMVYASYRAQVFVDTINIPMILTLGSNGQAQTLSVANNGAAGAWASWHYNVSVRASTVYRTGGAAAGLLFKANSASATHRGTHMAPRPFAAKAVAPGTTGLRRVTMYLAAKGVSADLIFKNLIVEVTAPSGASGFATFSSAASGRLETDSSVWNNDTGLSMYRLVTIVRVDRNENLGVRVSFRGFESTTNYIYVDPKIDVSA